MKRDAGGGGNDPLLGVHFVQRTYNRRTCLLRLFECACKKNLLLCIDLRQVTPLCPKVLESTNFIHNKIIFLLPEALNLSETILHLRVKTNRI
jgi:hypothetical protein